LLFESLLYTEIWIQIKNKYDVFFIFYFFLKYTNETIFNFSKLHILQTIFKTQGEENINIPT